MFSFRPRELRVQFNLEVFLGQENNKKKTNMREEFEDICHKDNRLKKTNKEEKGWDASKDHNNINY